MFHGKWKIRLFCCCGEVHDNILGKVIRANLPENCFKCGKHKRDYKAKNSKWKRESTWYKPWTWRKGYWEFR